MRALILTAVTVLAGLAAAPAAASSIQPVVGQPTTATTISVVKILCPSCPPEKTPEEVSGYRVPTLPAGTQQVEIKDIDGEKKLVRTEAWMGGSPVTFVSSSPFWISEQPPVVAGLPGTTDGDGIDMTAQTAAVATPEAAPVVAATAGSLQEPPPLDIATFQLRLN